MPNAISKPPPSWSPIVAGLAVTIGSVLLAIWLAYAIDYSHFPEIQFVCEKLSVNESTCRDGAISAGISSLLGLLAAAAATALVYRKIVHKDGRPIPDAACALLSATAVIICGLDVIRELMAHGVSDRQNAIAGYASLENLLWPLLLQFFVSATRVSQRLITGSALLLIAAMSPFRGVVFAIALFGGAVPIIMHFSRSSFPRKWASVAIALLFLVVSLSGVLFLQTKERMRDGDWHNVTKALTQRVVMPLFQAYGAYVFRDEPQMPNLADNIETKLRLSHGLNLNQFLYRRIYGDGVGETTALFYGEAVSNFRLPPAVVIFLAAMVPILAAIAFQALGFAASTLCAVALWRGSLGGISDVIPALVIQLGSGFILQQLNIVPRVIFFRGACAALSAVAIGHLTAMWMASQHDRLIGYFTIAPVAAEAVLKCGNVSDTVSKQAAKLGILDSTTVTSTNLFESRLIIYLGVAPKVPEPDDRYRLFKRVQDELSSQANNCNATPADSIRFDYSRVEKAGTMAPLDFAAILLPIFAIFRSFRRRSTPDHADD